MRSARVLNPKAAAATLEPAALSQRLLAAARAASRAQRRSDLDRLAAQLHAVRPQSIQGDAARVAFWINVYNALLLDCLGLRPLRGSVLRHRRLFDRIAYRVGAHDYPLNVIENGVLRRNRRAPLRARRPLRAVDPRLGAAPTHLDPRIHFALNCGARSCPPVRTYDGSELDSQLEQATAAYLRAETTIDPEGRRVILPRLMRIYRRDFGSRHRQLAFAGRYVPEIGEWTAGAAGRLRVRYGRFDWAAGEPASG